MAPDAERRLLWQELTREEIAEARDRGAVVALPVGAIEQHGGHLPVETDARLCTAVTRRASALAAVPVLVAPTLPFGFSPHHLAHAGTLSLRLDTYLAVVTDLVASLADTGFRRIVLVNGHGGNAAPLRAKVAELVTDGLPVTAVDYWIPAEAEWIAMLTGPVKRFGHACEFETSLMLAVAECAGRDTGPILDKAADLAVRSLQPWVPPGSAADPVTEARAAWPPVFQADDVGYFGDPASASAEKGRAMLEALATRLGRFFDEFARMPIRLGRGRGEASISPPLA